MSVLYRRQTVNTIDFLLIAKRDLAAVLQFLRKSADSIGLPQKIKRI